LILTEKHIDKLFSDFSRLRIMVIGDVMIDSYLNGVVERMSPEAPVPVVAVRSRFNRLGGAANVTLNLKAMEAEPILCSVIGQDDNAETFLQLMKEFALPLQGIVQSGERITTIKERVLGNRKQLLRIDEEDTHDLSQNELQLLETKIIAILNSQKIDAIILQDYNKGVLSKELIEKVIALANDKNIPITVDPKKEIFFLTKTSHFLSLTPKN
jgi:ADP-heptose synthase, bifunctional sugar kinase/adenylyltransferase